MHLCVAIEAGSPGHLASGMETPTLKNPGRFGTDHSAATYFLAAPNI